MRTVEWASDIDRYIALRPLLPLSFRVRRSRHAAIDVGGEPGYLMRGRSCVAEATPSLRFVPIDNRCPPDRPCSAMNAGPAAAAKIVGGLFVAFVALAFIRSLSGPTSDQSREPSGEQAIRPEEIKPPKLTMLGDPLGRHYVESRLGTIWVGGSSTSKSTFRCSRMT
jgi:hypothetical protein